jgi:hypothetical protein
MNRPTARTPPRDPNDRQQTASSSLSDADLWGKIRAERGGCGHENLEAGHWRMPCCAARPDPDGKAWRIGRCATRQARAALALKGASLDQVSGGRFLFGVGGGWNREEIEATVPPSRLMRERIEAMKAIWTEAKPEYHGEFVNFPPMMTWPKPMQKPYPPIIVVAPFRMPRAARCATATGEFRSPVAHPMAMSTTNCRNSSRW